MSDVDGPETAPTNTIRKDITDRSLMLRRAFAHPLVIIAILVVVIVVLLILLFG
jgi:hypothetical protein